LVDAGIFTDGGSFVAGNSGLVDAGIFTDGGSFVAGNSGLVDAGISTDGGSFVAGNSGLVDAGISMDHGASVPGRSGLVDAGILRECRPCGAGDQRPDHDGSHQRSNSVAHVGFPYGSCSGRRRLWCAPMPLHGGLLFPKFALQSGFILIAARVC
jgi:hypothetical protein